MFRFDGASIAQMTPHVNHIDNYICNFERPRQRNAGESPALV